MGFQPTRTAIILLCVCFSFLTTSIYSQAGINTKTPADGALLDITSSNKGFLLPQVALTSTGDVATITPSATEGLLVYNTATDGSLPFQVTPGFYYWNGSQWLRFYNRGYGIKFDQNAQTVASTNPATYRNITGLDTGDITIPYSGTYQVRVETAYACGNLSSTASDGCGQGSISLAMDTNNSGTLTTVKETYVTSTSKRINSTTIDNIPQNTTIIYNIDLDVLNTYRFVGRGREWQTDNVGTGTFGKNTNGYSGSTGINDAQRGTITLTLVRQQ